MLLKIFGHAYAGIAHREMDMAQFILFPIIFNDKFYRAIWRGIFYGIGQQIEKIAQTAMELLVLQMNEMKKRKPAPLKEPVHKQITPVLIRRNTTD